MKRLSPSIFKIPADKIRSGYYTDRYFLRTRDVLIRDRRDARVSYQFFPREDAVICGLDEAIAILKTCAGGYRSEKKARELYRKLRYVQWKFQDASSRQKKKEIFFWQKERARIREGLNHLWESGWKNLEVRALHDGDSVKEGEAVLVIKGDPKLFVHLETVLLGAVARPTATATAVARVVRAAGRKHIFFFSARFDHYWVQTVDGYAALKAGAFSVSTDANADYWGIESMGTIPHSLIACYEGNTAAACLAFDRHTAPSVNRIALIDWDNDCIGTTRKILESLLGSKKNLPDIPDSYFLKHARSVVGKGKGRLWGVRFDTSKNLRDRSVRRPDSYGVCPELIRKARRVFDGWGCRKLKMVVSGGFDEKKIRRFETLRLPVDAYGVGATLLRHRIDITADIVEYNGRPCAKVGRRKSDWSRLTRVR